VWWGCSKPHTPLPTLTLFPSSGQGLRCWRTAERNGSSRPAICGAEYSIAPSAVFSRPIRVPVTVALARLRTVLVVISPDRDAGLALRRFLHDQPCRQLNQFVLRRCCA
jgi:hypothetical protein